MKLFLVALLLLLIPFVSGFDCIETVDPSYCRSVDRMDISEDQKDLLYSLLLYQNHTTPDHDFINDYNSEIRVRSRPYETSMSSSTYVKNMWVALLNIHPSVYENNNLFVPNRITVTSAFDYDIELPDDYESSRYPRTSDGDCKRTYTLTQNLPVLRYYFNGDYKGSGRTATFDITESGELRVWLNVLHSVRIEHHEWVRFCCSWNRDGCVRHCYDCVYDYTENQISGRGRLERKQIYLYEVRPTADVTFVNQYYDTSKGIYSGLNYSQLRIDFPESYIQEQNKYYDVVFEKKPHYIAYLRARNHSEINFNNLYLTNNTFFVKTSSECTISSYNHFYESVTPCDMTLHPELEPELSISPRDSSLRLLIHIILFLLLVYVIYRLIGSQWKKITLPTLALIGIPSTFASDCGLTNLASCIPEKIYEFILLLINAPLLPMINQVQALLVADVYIDAFHHVWSIMRYIVGFFYVFMFIYAGYVFLVSSANPLRRNLAKDMLKDTVIMMVLIHSSFYLYDLTLSLSSILNLSILDTIDPHFFMLTADSIVNIGLEFLFAMAYAMTLFLTMLMLSLRYLVVCFGVIMLPFSLFCYFTPPLKGYGKFMLSMLGIFIFITFIDLLIILGCSMLIEIALFENMKILVMICCFNIVNYTLWLAIKFAMKMAAMTSMKDDLNQAVKYLALAV